MRSAAKTMCFLAVLAATAVALRAEDSVWSKARANRPAPPQAVSPRAGEYRCFTIAMGATLMTPYGSSATTTPMPSAIDRLELDGDGTYRQTSGQSSRKGSYEYDGASGRVIFGSGPLKGWTTRSETDGNKRWLRFAAKLGADLAPTSRIGDHICNAQ